MEKILSISLIILLFLACSTSKFKRSEEKEIFVLERLPSTSCKFLGDLAINRRSRLDKIMKSKKDLESEDKRELKNQARMMGGDTLVMIIDRSNPKHKATIAFPNKKLLASVYNCHH